jgi:hypothetical protein
VKRISHSDRRRETRFPHSFEVRVRELPQLGTVQDPEIGVVPGRIQNISQGGVCLVTSIPVETSAVLRCEIAMDDVPLHVPTLMQVRWTQKYSVVPESFISGLESLL